ncbi:uncharacterized protein LOC130442534 isoform X2 [Diorhabda sublineata]|uniref:uncharacterized protein LOC130442534 isoform X2 n=1 Tax=Diorhabda sublineata TaxID=1163346 RepID=UPI0024E0D57C|nr:uncharacterized protein LOC130442534 isoform X2 [Diorhabda sublineata]
MVKNFLLAIKIILVTFIARSSALWCYQCVSTQPGCGNPFNWLFHWTKVCPEDDDVCVKILEQKNADHYEGCRPAAVDVKLANYVNNSVKELDIYRNYYDNTTWCFCFLDHRCNSGISMEYSITYIVTCSIVIFHQLL